jgi:hypothetical protein
MRGAILRPTVRLDLDDAPDAQARRVRTHKERAEEGTRGRRGVRFEERARERESGVLCRGARRNGAQRTKSSRRESGTSGPASAMKTGKSVSRMNDPIVESTIPSYTVRRIANSSGS